jgi:hypothetical protein
MPLYLQAFCHPDYSDIISGTAIDIKDDVFQDASTSYSLAKDYFFINFIPATDIISSRVKVGTFPSTYGISNAFVYIPFDYKSGISSINPAFINSSADLATVITSSGYIKQLISSTYQNLSDPNSSSYIINPSEVTIIIVNKFYCNFRDVFYDQYGIESYTTLQNDSIYVNFSFAKLISIDVGLGTGNSKTNVNFIVKSEKTYDYLEDFSSKIFYSAGVYYTDAAFTKLANLKVRKEFFPFLLLNNDSEEIRGKVTSDLKNLDDLNLADLGEDLNANDYVDITPVDPPIINQNTITCSVNSPGYADVVYNGFPYSYEDSQICGDSPVTNGNPIAVIRRDNQSNLNLYKDFTALTSETVSIYANNFRYIKYVTLVSNSTVYVAFKDNLSVATSTIKFSSQVLDLSKYYSIEEDGDGYISGITFRFVVYKVSETEAGALTYDLTIPVSIYVPEIVSASYNVDSTKLELVSNYSTTIKYYLKGEVENLQTVSVTDSVDGLNQRTLIDIDVTSKSITANGYGFFYDFNGGTRAPYRSTDFNQSIDFDIKITSFALQLKNGSPLFTFRTFYDSSNTAITNLAKSPCLVGSFDNYRTYLNYTDVYDVIFAFVFTLANGFKSLFFEIGEGTDRYQLTSLISIPITRSELFKRADIDGKINLTVWLDNKIAFKIPFQFLNFSTSAPQVTSVSSPVVSGGSKISASFSFNYKYADLVSYSILDQDNAIVYGPITLARKSYAQLYDLFSSGSTASESIVTNLFDIQPSVTSLKVQVSASNLTSTFPFDLQSVSLQSSATSLPQQLNQQTPAEVKFYDDQAMTVEANYISRGVTYYAFLQLKDINGADILPANYGNYISTNPPPEFKAVESDDLNLDLDGVSVTKVNGNDYLYSFKISPSSPFNDSAFVLDITYSPIIGIPIRDDRIGDVTNS